MQRRRGQSVSRLHRDQPVPAQWGPWREGGPVWIPQHRHRKSERHRSALGTPRKLSATLRQRGFHLDTRAQQQQFALEYAESERRDQRIDCRRPLTLLVIVQIAGRATAFI